VTGIAPALRIAFSTPVFMSWAFITDRIYPGVFRLRNSGSTTEGICCAALLGRIRGGRCCLPFYRVEVAGLGAAYSRGEFDCKKHIWAGLPSLMAFWPVVPGIGDFSLCISCSAPFSGHPNRRSAFQKKTILGRQDQATCKKNASRAAERLEDKQGQQDSGPNPKAWVEA